MSEIHGASGGPPAASLQSLLGVMKALPDALVISDQDGLIIAANPAAEEMFGYGPNELDGQPIEVLLPERMRGRHPDHRAEYNRQLDRRWMGSRAGLFAVRRDGGEFAVDLTLSALETDDGSVVLAGIHDLSKRAHIEEALRASEESYRELFEGANDIIYTHDFEGNFTAVNPAGLRAFGYSIEELGRVNIAEIVDPMYISRARDEIVRKLKGGTESEPYELLTHTKKGARVWVEVSTRVIMEGDRAIGVQGIARDITDRKRAEEAARESEARLHAVAAAAPIAIAEIDGEGRFVLAEGQVIGRFGLKAEHGIGRSALRWFKDYPQVVDHIGRSLKGETVHGVVEMQGFVLDMCWTPRFGEGGAVTGVVMLATDVTERARAEEALRSASEFRDLVMESTTDAIAAFDTAGRFTLVNRRVEELTGFSADELIGRPFEMLRIPEETNGPSALTMLLRDGRPVSGHESEISRKDGARRVIRSNLGPIVKDGVVVGAAGIAADVTEELRAERLLTSQKRLLEMIAAGASLPEVLDAVARTVEQQADGLKCSILLLADDGRTLRSGANSGLPMAFFEAIDGMQTGPDAGACGAAAYLGTEVVTVDAETDPRCAGCRDLLAAHGLRSVWSTPILAADRTVLGTVAIYGPRPGEPDPRHRPLVEVATDIAGLAIERSRTEQALRLSEAQYRNIFERNSAIKLIVEPGTAAIVDANSAACAFYGYTHAELTSMTAFDLNTLRPERVMEELARAAGEEKNYFQFRHRLASGEVRDIEIYAGPFDAGDRRLVCSIIHDISERKQSEALLESHRQLMEMIAAGASLQDVLDTLVRTFEEQAPGALCSVLLLDAGGTQLRHASAPSLHVEYSRAIDGIEIGPGVGSCGTAAYRREPVVVTDIEHDPLWAGFRDLALGYGLRSCWSMPILATSGDVLGTFAIYYREPRAPREQDRVLIEMATHVAGVAIARQRSEQALLSRNAELEELYKQLVRAHGDLAESKDRLEEKSVLLQRALDLERERGRIDTLTGTLNHAAITEELRQAIANADTGTVGIAMVDVDGLKVANDTYGHQTGDEVLVRVADALQRDGVIVGRYGGDEFVAILPCADRAAAERYRDDVLASLVGAGLTDPQTGAQVPVVASMGLAIYPHEAEAVGDLIRLSDSAMYASRRQRSMDNEGGTLPRTLGGERAAKMVGEIVPLLTSPGELAGKLRLVAHRITVGAGYDGVTFILKGPNETKGTTSAFIRLPDEEIERWNQTLGTQLSPEIVDVLERTQRPIIIDDPEHDERLVRTTRAMLAFAGIKSALIAPMLWEGELIGALSVGSKRESGFSVRDADFVAAVATQVAAIVRMASFVEELQTSSAQLMRAHTETVLMLAGAAEAHDHTTGRHLQRVSELAEALARELGHDEAAARDLALAAVLHDIGKIRVPDIVLGSSSKLAESEWVLMKQHTIWGSEFLAGQQGFGLAATVARSHHERWDGGGYPSGLCGDEIPEAAQITSVADAFDAMTNDRPYRLGRPAEEAIGEIVGCSGTQFSPRVVAALVRLCENGALPFFEQDEHDLQAA